MDVNNIHIIIYTGDKIPAVCWKPVLYPARITGKLSHSVFQLYFCPCCDPVEMVTHMF